MSAHGNPRTDWDHQPGVWDWYTATQHPGESNPYIVTRAKQCGELYSIIQHSSVHDDKDREKDMSSVLRCRDLKRVSDEEFKSISDRLQITYGELSPDTGGSTGSRDNIDSRNSNGDSNVNTENIESENDQHTVTATADATEIGSELPRFGHVRDKVSRYESISPPLSSGEQRPAWSMMYTTPTVPQTDKSKGGRCTPSPSSSRGTTGSVSASPKGTRRTATYGGSPSY